MEAGQSASRRRASLLFAAILLVAAVTLFAFTADKRGDSRQFFGLWRMRHFLPAIAALWLAIGALAAARSRTALWKWIAVSLSAAFTLLLIELVGLTGVVNFERMFQSKSTNPFGMKRIPNIDVGGETYQDTWTRWGVHSDPIPFRFKTDKRGFRNEQDREAADIYLLGDSMLVAGLLPFDRTLTHQLESKAGHPVMSIALIGISVQEERDMLKEVNPPLKDRLVIHFVFEGNDPQDSRRYRREHTAGGSAPEKIDWTKRSPTYHFLMALQRLSQPIDPIAKKRIGYIGDQPYAYLWVGDAVRNNEAEFPYILDALADTRKFVEAAGGRYAVVVVPEKYRVLAPFCRWPAESDLADYESNLSPMSKAVTDWCQAQGVPVLELVEPLQESVRQGRVPWFPGDTHWNEIGHAVAAEAIMNWAPAAPLLAPSAAAHEALK